MKKYLKVFVTVLVLLVGSYFLSMDALANDTATIDSEKEQAKAAGITAEQFEQIMNIPNLASEDILSDELELAKTSGEQQKVVRMAKAQLGKPYVWGASGPNSFDCGGLVKYVYQHAVNIQLPMGTFNQEKYGKEVSLNALQPGDLLFYGKRGQTYHVSIFIGNGQYIHAPKPGEVVKVASLNAFRPSFAKRLLKDAPVNRPNNNGQAPNERYIFRLYNPNEGNHHYTQLTAEARNLQNRGWVYEGVGWVAPDRGKAVYRLYNRSNGRHHYTMNTQERDQLIRLGWKYEGVSWQSGGKLPVYRLYNPKAKGREDSHHYTTNTHERDALVRQGWKHEGVAWYAVRNA